MEAQPETDAAVAETEGKIITCGGEPIQAYFFSTSCGKTSTDGSVEYGGDGRISEERDGRRGEAGTGDGGGVCIVYHQKGQHKSGSGGPRGTAGK